MSFVNSIIYLDQVDKYSTPDLVCISIGIVIIVFGVWLLSKSQGQMVVVDDLPELRGERDNRASVCTNGEDDVDRLLQDAEAMVVEGTIEGRGQGSTSNWRRGAY